MRMSFTDLTQWCPAASITDISDFLPAPFALHPVWPFVRLLDVRLSVCIIDCLIIVSDKCYGIVVDIIMVERRKLLSCCGMQRVTDRLIIRSGEMCHL